MIVLALHDDDSIEVGGCRFVVAAEAEAAETAARRLSLAQLDRLRRVTDRVAQLMEEQIRGRRP